MPTLHGIYVYPIKAVGPVALEAAVVEPHGLRHDRRWMLVDDAGVFISQREHPKLGRVRVATADGRLHVEAPGLEPLTIARPSSSLIRRTVRIWRDEVPAVPADAAAHAWFSSYLGASCWLVFLDDPTARPVDPRFRVGDDVVSFADGFPVLLTAEASLAALNARLAAPVGMDRFRPNLVVGGTDAFEEDDWREVRIGEVLFHVVKPCARCVVTTIDPDTAVPGKEPLRTLAAFRRHGGKVYFGENLIPARQGEVRLGDTVEVVTRSAGGLASRLSA